MATANENENDPAVIMEGLGANPDQLAMLKQNNAVAYAAYASGSLGEFSKVIRQQQAKTSDVGRRTSVLPLRLQILGSKKKNPGKRGARKKPVHALATRFV